MSGAIGGPILIASLQDLVDNLCSNPLSFELHLKHSLAARAEGLPILNPKLDEGNIVYYSPCLQLKDDSIDGFLVKASSQPHPYLRLATGTVAQEAKRRIKTPLKEVGLPQFLYLGIG